MACEFPSRCDNLANLVIHLLLTYLLATALCLCPSVSAARRSSVERLNESIWFWHRRFFSHILHCVMWTIRVPPKGRVLHSDFVPNSGLITSIVLSTKLVDDRACRHRYFELLWICCTTCSYNCAAVDKNSTDTARRAVRLRQHCFLLH